MTRVPVVLGLGRRSGTGTVAAALHAEECRRPPLVACAPGIWSADIAVCAGDRASLGRAEAVRGAAVLLVVLVDDTAPPTHARQQELARRHGSVVVLPHVREWAGLSGIPAEAAALFARQPEQLSPALCAYTRGLRLAVAALLGTGVLTRAQPPALIWSPPTAWSSPTAAPPPTSPRSGRPRAAAPRRPDAPTCPRPSAPAPSADDCPRAAPTAPSPTDPTPTGPSPTDPAPTSPASAVPAPAGRMPVLGLDDDAIEAEVLAAIAKGSESAAAMARPAEPAAAAGRPTGPAAAATSAPRPPADLTPGRPATHLRIRALHRPVMGPVRGGSAKAG